MPPIPLAARRYDLRVLSLLAACCLALPWAAPAQPLPQDDPPEAAQAPAAVWTRFGPATGNGAFFDITGTHLVDLSGHAVAADSAGRILILADWRDSLSDPNLDCAVSRYLPNAKALDMDYSGDNEATRRLAFDLGGANADHCQELVVDALSRAVVVGYATTSGNDSGIVARLKAADGTYDGTFSGNGKVALQELSGLAGLETRLADVATYADGRVLACGYVDLFVERNMLVVRFRADGTLDTTFNGTGIRDIDFSAGPDDIEGCQRLLLLPDGRIVVAGAALDAAGSVGYGIARLQSNGSFDTSWSGDGKVVIADGTAATPTVADLAWDAARQRLLVAGTLFEFPFTSNGDLVALTGAGALDTSFSGDGRRSLRFSALAALLNPRDDGETILRRIVLRADGGFYAAGTHVNASGDAATYGTTDLAVAKFHPDGAVDIGGFNLAGVGYYAFPGVGHADVLPAEARLDVADVLEDVLLYRGNLLLLSDTDRYPAGTWGGSSVPQGPKAPLLAGVVAQRIWSRDWEYDELPAPTTAFDEIPVPSGYGRYCSATHPDTGASYLLASSATGVPCTVILITVPGRVIERAGLYSLNGTNDVLAVCDGGYIAAHSGNGAAPFDAAEAAAAGRTHCVFTAAPRFLRIFDRPYTGSHLATTAQSFNHDVYNLALNVSVFGQTPNPAHPSAHFVDLNGRQMCDGPDANGVDGALGGVDEAAVDIGLHSDRFVLAVADGRVESAVPRYVLSATGVGGDPYQREIFVRHSVGTGLYSEAFTSYYAHMSDTLVRRGEAILQGEVLGRVGTTGASSGDHLHIAVFRHRNLSFRDAWEVDYGYLGLRFDGRNPGAIDPWGWRAPAGVDPWTWRFEANSDAGSWSPVLWNPGEAPTMD